MKKAKNKYLNYLLWRLWDIRHFGAGVAAYVSTQARFARTIEQAPHGLSAPLIVSLTSYPRRFGALAITLKSLMTQTVRPDRIILWIAPQDMEQLPPNVLKLRGRGLEINEAEDTGPYKKLVPSLLAYPDAYIVTADDDIYYQPDWLAGLLSSWSGDASEIVGHRGLYIKMDSNDLPAPYTQWSYTGKEMQADALFFATGGAGCLYPPGSLARDVTDKEKFLSLCPRTDDIWFYWMGRRAGSSYKKTHTNWRMINWPFTQKAGLYHENVSDAGNDKNIANMIKAYGWPPTEEEGAMNLRHMVGTYQQNN